jgi:hypothetical protein
MKAVKQKKTGKDIFDFLFSPVLYHVVIHHGNKLYMKLILFNCNTKTKQKSKDK